MKATHKITGAIVYVAPYQDGKLWVSATLEDYNIGAGRCDYADNYIQG